MSDTNEKHLTTLEKTISDFRNKQLLLADAIALCDRKRLQYEYEANEEYRQEYIAAQEIVTHLMKRVDIEMITVKCAAGMLARARSHSPRRASP